MVTNVYVSRTKWFAVAQFAITTAYTLGQYIRQLATPAYGNERVFKCTTAGTTAGTEPSWNLGNNATTTSGTATFTQVGGQEAEQSAGNWKAPLASAQTATTLLTAGTDVSVYTHSDHTETSTAALTLNSGNCNFVMSVKTTAATLPPVNADYERGAQIITTGNSGINIQSGYWEGFDILCGTGSGGASFQLGSGNFVATHLDDCSLQMLNTNGGNSISFESTPTFPGYTRMRRVKIRFSAAGQTIILNNAANVEWYDTPVDALDSAGTIPTNMFTYQSNTPHRTAIFHGLDLSALNTNLFTGAVYSVTEFWDCKLHASTNLRLNQDVNDPVAYLSIVNCDDSTSGKNFRFFKSFMGGFIWQDQLVVATGGATDGVTPIGHRYTVVGHGGLSPSYYQPFVGHWMTRRYNTTGASKTLTIEGILFRGITGTAPLNKEIWLETEVLDNAGSPLASCKSTRQVSPMGAGTALTTSTVAWDTGAPARQNSHAYAFGDYIKVASNPNRVFRNGNTGGGSTGGSEPGAFATAVDGDVITDSGCTWVCGQRFKLQSTFTPALKGAIRCRVIAAIGVATQGTVFHIDPKLYIA